MYVKIMIRCKNAILLENVPLSNLSFLMTSLELSMQLPFTIIKYGFPLNAECKYSFKITYIASTAGMLNSNLNFFLTKGQNDMCVWV